MIVQGGKHYLYRHIRKDTNEPFYIGIGTKIFRRNQNNDCNIYQRALQATGRNKHWKNIVSKAEYEIEIMFESDDYSFIQTKEIEFISMYGRADLKQGTLCNWTDGGDGCLNIKKSPESIQKGIAARKKLTEERGYYFSEETRKRLSDFNKSWIKPKEISEKLFKPVSVFNLEGKLIKQCRSLTEASEFTKSSMGVISSVLYGKKKSCNGFTFRFYKETIEWIDPVITHRKKKILKMDELGNVITEYPTVKAAVKELKCTKRTLLQRLENGNIFRNFYWRIATWKKAQ